MAWYWIVLIVIGYIFIAIITGVLYGVVLEEDTDMCTLAGTFWPIMLPIFIVMLPVMLLHAILDCLL